MHSASWVPHYQTLSCHSCQIPRPVGVAALPKNLEVHRHLAHQSQGILRAREWVMLGVRNLVTQGCAYPSTSGPDLPAPKMPQSILCSPLEVHYLAFYQFHFWQPHCKSATIQCKSQHRLIKAAAGLRQICSMFIITLPVVLKGVVSDRMVSMWLCCIKAGGNQFKDIVMISLTQFTRTGLPGWTARPLNLEKNCHQFLKAIFSATCVGSDLILAFFPRIWSVRRDHGTLDMERTGMYF